MSRLKQPGAPLQPRRLAAWASGVTDLLITLPAGADLMTGLVEALAERGIEQAGLVLLSGELRAASFMTGRPDVSGHRIATHAGPWDLAGPLSLLGGNAILGRGAEAAALLHCHAVFATPEGRLRGGHLRPGRCPLGPGGLRALAACPQGAGFQVAEDSETNFSIFHPFRLAADGTREVLR